MTDAMKYVFDPTHVDLTSEDLDPAKVVCFLSLGENEYNGRLGDRISALFVILAVSSAATFFPVIATRVPRLRIPVYVYLFARYFGAGVIIATAFIHLLDPAYGKIGPNTCVGMTGGWASYSWVAGIVLTSVMLVFLLDFGAERYVEHKFGFAHGHPDIEGIVATGDHVTYQAIHSGDQNDAAQRRSSLNTAVDAEFQDVENGNNSTLESDAEVEKPGASIGVVERSFHQQIAAFLILEFGIIFHSVIIGLNLGTAGDEFSTLYPVLVIHQSFEGLGIGARLSSIPIPKRLNWLPWSLCAGYGLTTPIAIAIGLCLRTTYNAGSFAANAVSGVLDAISAGILIYTGLVELLARDFLFNRERTRDGKRLTFMVVCVFLGAALMALLGKWA
ncbi:hypothetical protein ACLOAV_006512 [Pseudogymnoascus australis]